MVNDVKKKKRVLNARFLWLILVVISIIFFVSFVGIPLFPLRWSLILLGILAGMLLVTGILSAVAWRSFFARAVNILLSLILAAGSVLLPRYSDKVTSLFESISGTEVSVSLYVMNEDYCAAHPEYYPTSYVSDDLDDFVSSVFISCVSSDRSNQEFALEQLNSHFGTDVSVLDCSSVLEAAGALYRNEGDVLILSDTMLSMVTETEAYSGFLQQTIKIGTYTRTISGVGQETVDLTGTPFCIFFGGNDEEGDLYLEGRTDVDMLVTVNPETYQIAIVSLPRDSYIPNPAFGGSYDKLTHLGLSGIENTLQGLNAYLGTGDLIDHYVIINFRTFRNIIDAIGGVDVENDIAFTAIDGQYYPEGQIHLEGEYALMYVRERYAFLQGDFERNYHQQLVMQAMITKLTSPSVIAHFDDLLDSLQGTFLTNISGSSIFALCRKQLAESISWNIVSYHIVGETGMEYCAAVPEDLSSVVYPYDSQIRFAAQVMQDVVNGNVLVQQDLPEGTYDGSVS